MAPIPFMEQGTHVQNNGSLKLIGKELAIASQAYTSICHKVTGRYFRHVYLGSVQHYKAVRWLAIMQSFQKILIFIRRDLFPPDAKLIQNFITGTCTFMYSFIQVHTVIMLAYFFYSLSREFSTNPGCSSASLPSLGPCRVFFFHHVSAQSESSSGGGIRQQKDKIQLIRQSVVYLSRQSVVYLSRQSVVSYLIGFIFLLANATPC